MGKECFNCSVTVGTYVANQFQPFGHDNYSRLLCLLVVLKTAYLKFYNSFSECHQFLAMCKCNNPSEVINTRVGWLMTMRMLKVLPEFVAHNSLFPLKHKMLALVLFEVDCVGAYKLAQPFCSNPNVDKCVFSQISQKKINSLLICFDKQLFTVAFVFHYNTYIGVNS